MDKDRLKFPEWPPGMPFEKWEKNLSYYIATLGKKSEDPGLVAKIIYNCFPKRKNVQTSAWDWFVKNRDLAETESYTFQETGEYFYIPVGENAPDTLLSIRARSAEQDEVKMRATCRGS